MNPTSHDFNLITPGNFTAQVKSFTVNCETFALNCQTMTVGASVSIAMTAPQIALNGQITAGGSPQGTTQDTQAGGAASAPSSYLPSGGSSQPVQQVTISLDLLSVSTAFLDYVGGEEVFYQKAFDYVVQSGLTGAITGTMNNYEIDADAGKANIQITLSTGQNLNAIYNKQKNSFQFSGL